MSGIIYTRVSSREQADNNTSLDQQAKACLEYARKQKVLISEDRIFREEGESAKVANRTELSRLFEYVRRNKGKIDTLYIWKIDRLSRNLSDYYSIKVLLSRLGIRIVSVTEPIDDDPVGRFLEAILAAAAQFDNDIRAVRTVGGMRARVAEGKWPHMAPIGYIKQNKRIVMDPVKGPVIKDMLIKFSEGGHSLSEMSQYAFDMGVMTKSGRPKSTDAIKDILQNPIYAGYTRNKLVEGLNKGLHKPMVEPGVIEKNIDIITGRKKNYILRGDDMYPLKGVLICSRCRSALRASAPTGRSGERYPMYHCVQKTCRRSVTGVRASKSVYKVHEQFRAILEALKPLDEGIERLYKEYVLRKWNDEYSQAVERIKYLNKQIDDDRVLRQKTGEKFIADQISQAERDLQYQALDQRISDVKSDLEDMELYVEENEAVIHRAMELISDPAGFWNRSSTPVKQMVQLLFFPDGVIYDFETGFGTAEKLESHLLLQKMTGEPVKISDLVAPGGPEPPTSGL